MTDAPAELSYRALLRIPGLSRGAFAVSMAVNYMGVPIGAGLAGILAAQSLELAIVVLGIGAALAATASAAFLVPRQAPEAGQPLGGPELMDSIRNPGA